MRKGPWIRINSEGLKKPFGRSKVANTESQYEHLIVELFHGALSRGDSRAKTP